MNVCLCYAVMLCDETNFSFVENNDYKSSGKLSFKLNIKMQQKEIAASLGFNNKFEAVRAVR